MRFSQRGLVRRRDPVTRPHLNRSRSELHCGSRQWRGVGLWDGPHGNPVYINKMIK